MNQPDPVSIKNILTLRYDPTRKPILPKLSWRDFLNKDQKITSELIENSIEKNIKNSLSGRKERIVVALSGGVDSALMLSILRKVFPEIKIEAISIKFENSVDETPLAAKIAEEFEANHHIMHLENFLAELPKAISIAKLPFWDLHWYYMVKSSQNFSKYLVSGDGGDELFGGYTFRYQKFLSSINNQLTPLDKIKVYLQCHERDWVEDQTNLFGKNIVFSWDEFYDLLLPYFNNLLPPLEQVFLADYNGKLLYNFSINNSSFYDYFDMKSLTPMLSEDMIVFAKHLPIELKYDKERNLGKIILRNLHNKHIKKDLIPTEKFGFTVNTKNLWKSHAKELCDYYLGDARIVNDGWINNDWIKTNFKKLDNQLDVRIVNKFLGLLAFEIWYRLFVTQEISSNTTLN